MTSLGTCRLVMPLSESTIARAGPSARPGLDGGLDRGAVVERRRAAPRRAPRPSLGEMPAAPSASPYSAKTSGKNPDDVAEDDRVGDLHHRGLEVHREEHVLGLGPGDLLGEEGVAARATSHEGGVDDLAGEHRQPLLEHRRRAVGADVLDRAACRRPSMTTDFSLERKSSSPMVATLVFESAAPGAHRVRVFLGVVLDRRGRAAVGVALAQHRVHRAALDLVVAGAGVLLLVGLRVLRVVREVVALRLQLRDRRLELRDRGADVGQLDDVGLGRLGERAELGERVVDALLGGAGARGTARGCGRPARCRASRRRRRPCAAYAATIGRNEYVASSGASSVWV